MLEVNLFGTPSVKLDGSPVTLPYKKAEALFYYLVLRGQTSRSELIGLLWTDEDSTSAMKNLRHAIYSIRKALGFDPFGSGQRAFLTLDAALPLRCDVLEFLERDNLSVYRGEFLQDFTIHRAGAFEIWLTEQRSQLQTRYLNRLLQMGQEHYAAGNWAQAERCGLDYLAVDPLEETAVALLMQVYCVQKKFRKVISLYNALREGLEDEFSIAPLKETTALYYSIVNQWNGSADDAEEPPQELLVGKDQALRRLLALCNGTANRPTPCVLVEGEAGVGKTYLVDYILNHYDFSDRLTCRSFCYQSEVDVPLAAWNSVMLTLSSEIESRRLPIPPNYLKTAAGVFPCLAPESVQSYAEADGNFPLQVNFHTAQESVLLLLSLLARQAPLLLVFEDLHWMDRKSAELLARMLRRLRNQNVMVICTSRNLYPAHIQTFLENAQRDGILERYPLRHFTQEETGQFAAHCLGETQPAERVAQFYQYTEGNALLLAQLMRALQESGDGAEIPQNPDSIISYRLSDLRMDERQVLDLISVFTEWAPFEMLSAILETDPLRLSHLCSQLTLRMLIAESTRNGTLGYTLAHERIKAILAAEQSASSRRFLHLQVARHLEAHVPSAPHDKLMYHYAAGGDRFHAFAHSVLSLNAYAGLCYELMPMLHPETQAQKPDEERLLSYFQTLTREMNSLRAGGASPEALAPLESLLLYAESRYSIHNGLYERGLELLERLTSRCNAQGDTELLIKAHLQFVYYGIQTYDTAVMASHLSEIDRLLEDRPLPERGIYLRLSGLQKLMEGAYEDARALMRQSIRYFSELDPDTDGQYAINIAGVYNYIAECFRLEGNYDEAFRYYDQAILYNRSRGYYPGAAVFYTNYGVAAWEKGERDVARHMLAYAEDIYGISHEYSERPIALAYLALYDVEDGNLSRARQRLQEGLRICEMIGSPWWKGVMAYVTWEIRQRLDQVGAAAEGLRELWPAEPAEHCQWVLSFLKQLPRRRETAVMEAALSALSGR